MKLPRWLKPIKDGTKRARQVLLRKPPTPSAEEFISPLRQELTELAAVKPDIGYNEHCASCRGHKTIDTQITTAIAKAEDPQPWLQELHTELVKTEKELISTRQELREAKRYYTPQNRMKWAIYGAVASGSAVLALKGMEYAANYIYNVLPTLIPYIMILFGLG